MYSLFAFFKTHLNIILPIYILARLEFVFICIVSAMFNYILFLQISN